MKVMVVGGGGREHAIIKKLRESDRIDTIYALPGNGGIASDAVCVPVGATDIDGIVAFAKENGIDFAVVAPDDPLAMGCVDALNAIGIRCFGPVKDAAIIESSKVFSKNLMKKYGIPTARYEVFTDMDKALAYLKSAPIPTVVKADGLALGKGVIIAQTREEAEAAVRSMMEEKKFGDSGNQIVIEEFLTGPEVSVLSFTDGKTIVPMVSSQDHKRALDGDQGLNTGGMGTVAPNPYYTEEVAAQCMEQIFLPTMNAMNEEGRTFKGCLYFGLMITEDGPKVIEYNCRFGDPETQVVLPLLESDLFTIMEAVADERLSEVPVRFADKSSCCVVVASGGYPVSYEKGFPMQIGELDESVDLFIAGAKLEDGTLRTSGGRVLGVTCVADDLKSAIAGAYENVKKISFEKAFYRTDIGKRALAAANKVHRVYVEKKEMAANEARGLLSEVRTFLGIEGLEKVRILNRYDVEGVDPQLFETCIGNVFSEPQVDTVYRSLEEAKLGDGVVFAVEALPGQFDQRADSAAQCIQIISQKERPLVAYAKVYALCGDLSEEEIAAVKKHVINPVETREASLEEAETLKVIYDAPPDVAVLEGFVSLEEDGLDAMIADLGLAMDRDDLKFCQNYFREEGRAPTLTEIRMIDTYWSDHCRHTTFNTIIDDVKFEDEVLRKAYSDYLKTREALGRTKPVTLMDLGTIAAKVLKAAGKMPGLDESEEINACTVKIEAKIDGVDEDWLLLFKNETHNHPTEIEPFGGAATCIGGAIRDPLSGRAYVYTAMRITGAADPLRPLDQTLEGKLPQRKIVTSAADGYSSYGNQIGVTTGLVEEIYHDGYAAKHMELGAVVGAAPAANVIRERPEPGDIVILLGGKTGRDGCGGATGSSKSHDVSSLESCGAEVQKGNAPEERKLQRLFRNGEASRMIRRCNDFGAGGVSVAIGELADGLDIDLDVVPKKYEGLDGTELAISESQERMAVVIAPENRERFFELAASENLEATVVATVTEDPRLVMHWRGSTIVDIARSFLDSNGAPKHITVDAPAALMPEKEITGTFTDNFKALAADLNVCSKRGLSEKFDSTIGAGTILMPFGGKYQLTPPQVMAQKVSVEESTSSTVSIMSWGYNPVIMKASPYHGAYLAVVDSVCKLICSAGTANEATYLSFQEFFEKLGKDPARWGKPFAALLGAYRAQLGLEAAAIGGKDSMSGSFENIDVPPTLVSFAITTAQEDQVVSPEFKGAGHSVWLLEPELNEEGLPDTDSLKKNFAVIRELAAEGKLLSAWTPGFGGIAEGVMKMAFGNMVGFAFAEGMDVQKVFGWNYGSFVLETEGEVPGAALLGTTKQEPEIVCGCGGQRIPLSELLSIYENKLESIYPCNIETAKQKLPDLRWSIAEHADARVKAPQILTAKPKVLIPAFPGTNCEYDSARAFASAGAEPEIFVIRNLTAGDIAASVEGFAEKLSNSQMFFIPGGFSGGDEPDGSGKFITAFFRNPAVKEAVTDLLDERGGLATGICNGFQALIKLGLVPFGRILDTDENCPTLTYNEIGRHQSRLVRIRVASDKSPWLSKAGLGEIYTVPVSHGEGRLIAPEDVLEKLAENGQIATQYVDFDGKPSDDIHFNPNGSMYAIEGMTSPDGRVFGKMGHAERVGSCLYKNVPGKYDMKMFESAADYFKKF